MGRIAKWGIRLGAFDIRYKPRNSVKGQVLANFVAEFSPRDEGRWFVMWNAVRGG